MKKLLATVAWFVSACALALAQPSPERHLPPAESGTIASGPFKLRYIVEGSGPPAIVVGSALYYQRAFSPRLRQHLRLVFVDHRGFAPSPGQVDVSEFALEKLLADVEKTRTQLGLGRVVIIGHSGHGFMALEYGKRYPQSVSHVVMIGIGPDNSAASRAAARRAWAESVSPERKAALEENLRRITDDELAKLSPEQRNVRNYVRNGPMIWFDPQFDSTPLWEGVEINIQMRDHVWGEIFRDIDITQGLSTFAVPVLLALGRYDFIVPRPASWDPLRPKFRDLTIRVFERSGHTPQYEEPELFDAELLQWINARTPSVSSVSRDWERGISDSGFVRRKTTRSEILNGWLECHPCLYPCSPSNLWSEVEGVRGSKQACAIIVRN
jgi:proline iminopeptidase